MYILKVGGGRNINWDYIAEDLKSLKEELIIVHGANAWAAEIAAKLGIKEKFITSPSGHISRYTDSQAMDLLTMTYSGLVNKKIVAILRSHGINAIGVSGADGGIWIGKKKEAILSVENGKEKVIRDSLTGNVESVNSSLINLLTGNGYTPVITIPAVTAKGELINVDNDRAVAVMARDLEIKKIVMLFEASGLLRDKSDESSSISKIDTNEIDQYIRMTEGRMRKKLLGVAEAISFGVRTIYFGDGRIKNPVSNVLSGKGTIIT